MFQRFLTLFLICAGWAATASAAELTFAGTDSVLTLRSVYAHKTLFLQVDDIASRLPITVVRDSTAGLYVLCSRFDCIPTYELDTLEILRSDSGVYIKTERVAEALNCKMKIRKKSRITFTAPWKVWPVKPGREVDEAAAGFVLPGLPDSVQSLSGMLKDKPVILVFVRSGDWDPLSRRILKDLLASADTIRMAGYEVAVVHGGPPRDAAKWLKATAYPFRFISDQYTAVMRAYGVFDRGHLAHPSIFIVDQSGTLRFRRVFDEPDVVPDLAHLMMMVKQNRK